MAEPMFAQQFGDAFLAVAVHGDLDTLVSALDATSRHLTVPATPSVDQISFRTETARPEDLPLQASIPIVEGEISRLAATIGAGPRYAVAIRKRSIASSAFRQRISVGRAMSSDIVLRHASISKFHAYFECERGDYYVLDAGSTNGTSVNGEALQPRQRKLVANGANVGFGSVNAVFLDASTLRRVIRSG